MDRGRPTGFQKPSELLDLPPVRDTGVPSLFPPYCGQLVCLPSVSGGGGGVAAVMVVEAVEVVVLGVMVVVAVVVMLGGGGGASLRAVDSWELVMSSPKSAKASPQACATRSFAGVKSIMVRLCWRAPLSPPRRHTQPRVGRSGWL